MNVRDLIGDTTRRLFVREIAGLPTPPVALMRKVVGTRRPAEIPFRYASGGLDAAADIRAILAVNDLKLRRARSARISLAPTSPPSKWWIGSQAGSRFWTHGRGERWVWAAKTSGCSESR